MATNSAYEGISYNLPIKDKTLNDCVQLIHKYNCEQCGWNFIPLKPGAFGYDNLVVSFHHVFSNSLALDKKLSDEDLEYVSDLVHEGWCKNYLYWTDNEPYIYNTNYIKPYNPLGDDIRNMCARTLYKDLPEDQKQKDRIIAKSIINILS
jgi:rubredoxin